MMAAVLLYFYGVLLGVALGAPGGRAIFLGLLGSGCGWVVPNFLLSARIASARRSSRSCFPMP
jgi:hypothetical protein